MRLVDEDDTINEEGSTLLAFIDQCEAMGALWQILKTQDGQYTLAVKHAETPVVKVTKATLSEAVTAWGAEATRVAFEGADPITARLLGNRLAELEAGAAAKDKP